MHLYLPVAAQGLQIMPYKDLGLDKNSIVIGHSTHCVIYQAYYCGMAVTVKRLVPPGNPKPRTLFKRHSFRVSPAISPSTSLDIGAGGGLRQTQSIDVVRPAALTPALLRTSSIGPISPIVVGRESSKALLPAADWIASDSQQAEYRIGAGWQLRAQQFWVLAKAKLAQTGWQFWDVASGQYFKTLLVKHRVRALERELCMISFTLCTSGNGREHQPCMMLIAWWASSNGKECEPVWLGLNTYHLRIACTQKGRPECS